MVTLVKLFHEETFNTTSFGDPGDSFISKAAFSTPLEKSPLYLYTPTFRRSADTCRPFLGLPVGAPHGGLFEAPLWYVGSLNLFPWSCSAAALPRGSLWDPFAVDRPGQLLEWPTNLWLFVKLFRAKYPGSSMDKDEDAAAV